MYQYIKKHVITVIGACFLLLVNSGLQVLAATKMAQLANYLIVKNMSQFVKTLVLIFALWFASFIVSFFENFLQENTTQEILSDIREDIISSLIKIPQDKFKQKSVDYYESYLQNDVNLIQKEGINTFFLIIRFGGNAVFALIALFSYSYILFITAILLVILVVLVPRFCKRYLTVGVDEISHANEKFLKYTSSGLHGYETLYAFNVLGEIKKLVSTGSQVLKKANVQNTVRRSSVDVVTSIINIGSQLLILGVTGVLHFQGRISAGAILATAELATKVFDSAGIINSNFAQLLSTSSIFAKFDALGSQVETQSQSFDKTIFPMKFCSLEFKKVTFAYPETNEKILDDFSYYFTSGNFYKLSGASGRGKSTLLKLATGQLEPNEGKILLNGINVNQIPQYIINAIIVYMPQAITIFPRSIDYNILLGRDFSNNQLKNVKKCFGISNQWRFDSLSGGQQQRVALARLVDSRDQLVLLDESFSSLDLKTTQDLIGKLLKRLDSVIVISHRNEEFEKFTFENLSLN